MTSATSHVERTSKRFDAAAPSPFLTEKYSYHQSLLEQRAWPIYTLLGLLSCDAGLAIASKISLTRQGSCSLRRMSNLDRATVDGFGDEWSRFDQRQVSEAETQLLFDAYFRGFPWSTLPPQARGFDLGCGSGRWAKLMASRVGELHCIDASEAALAVAKRNLAQHANCTFHHASVDDIPLEDGSMDFGYSLGVLHHVPNTQRGIEACVAKLKRGAPFLLYLYYAFDNRPAWFRTLWKVSDVGRRVISRLPMGGRYAASQAIAATVYLPLARTARALERVGVPVESFPLSAYRDRSFYIMRNDALDRFGTRLEQRFTADQIRSMMSAAGLDDVTISPGVPHWCAVGIKR